MNFNEVRQKVMVGSKSYNECDRCGASQRMNG